MKGGLEVRRDRVRSSVFLLLIVGPLIACGTLLGTSDDVDDNAVPPGSGLDGAAEASGQVDLDANVATCAAGRVSLPAHIHVTPTGVAGPGCGTVAQPCTLQAALARARAEGGATINLASGEYVDVIDLPPKTHLVGGWKAEGGAFVFSCDQRLVRLKAPLARNATVVVNDAPDAEIALVTLLSADRPPEPSETRYGIMARGSTTRLTLENVVVSAGPGGAGVVGTTGSAAPGTAPGSCPPGTGQTGGSGLVGDPPVIVYGPDGVTASVGSQGAIGSLGAAGTPGGPGEVLTGFTCSPLTAVMCSKPACQFAGQPGKSGCGGQGGSGGGAGTSGGGSIALFAWRGATVIVGKGILAADIGGAGGAGGPGGAGGLGTGGVAGAGESSECQQFLVCNAPECNDHTSGAMRVAQGGAAGGSGGAGGQGGQGGGGAGGPSFAIVAGEGAAVEVNGTITTFRPPAQGGPPNGLLGVSGERGP